MSKLALRKERSTKSRTSSDSIASRISKRVNRRWNKPGRSEIGRDEWKLDGTTVHRKEFVRK